MPEYQRLRTAADFDRAYLEQLRVEVWDDESIEDYGGPIELHIKDAVRINGMYYVKSMYQFYVKPASPGPSGI
ncbi:hypothetical protein [Paenibacillus daejeonensis]|uniref:hypothetical protein n=1 Tax=Paenibacillus daejeonensis TaxID=135193 RepID=UPI00036DFA61|nr:hypothetical protein [Paenibacillus daejeonensis]